MATINELNLKNLTDRQLATIGFENTSDKISFHFRLGVVLMGATNITIITPIHFIGEGRNIAIKAGSKIPWDKIITNAVTPGGKQYFPKYFKLESTSFISMANYIVSSIQTQRR